MEEQEGTVKWYSLAKGYGFITPDGGSEDVFVHHSSVPDEKLRPLLPGERVRYETKPTPRGLRAHNIRRL